MERKRITIINKLGLHARAAAKFVKLASSFDSEVRLVRGDQVVNGKSIMGVMMLAAEHGATIAIRANGPDAEQAVDTLAALVTGKFGES